MYYCNKNNLLLSLYTIFKKFLLQRTSPSRTVNKSTICIPLFGVNGIILFGINPGWYNQEEKKKKKEGQTGDNSTRWQEFKHKPWSKHWMPSYSFSPDQQGKLIQNKNTTILPLGNTKLVSTILIHTTKVLVWFLYLMAYQPLFNSKAIQVKKKNSSSTIWPLPWEIRRFIPL